MSHGIFCPKIKKAYSRLINAASVIIFYPSLRDQRNQTNLSIAVLNCSLEELNLGPLDHEHTWFTTRPPPLPIQVVIISKDLYCRKVVLEQVLSG